MRDSPSTVLDITSPSDEKTLLKHIKQIRQRITTKTVTSNTTNITCSSGDMFLK